MHWAEVRKMDLIYHMNSTNSYIFTGLFDIDCAGLRHETDNVQSWGVLERKNESKGVCKIIGDKGDEKRGAKAQSFLLLRRGNVASKRKRNPHWRYWMVERQKQYLKRILD